MHIVHKVYIVSVICIAHIINIIPTVHIINKVSTMYILCIVNIVCIIYNTITIKFLANIFNSSIYLFKSI